MFPVSFQLEFIFHTPGFEQSGLVNVGESEKKLVEQLNDSCINSKNEKVKHFVSLFTLLTLIKLEQN